MTISGHHPVVQAEIVRQERDTIDAIWPLIAQGLSPRAIQERTGHPEALVRRLYSTPAVAERIAEARAGAIAVVAEVAPAAARSLATLATDLDAAAHPGAPTQLRAATEVLDRVGVGAEHAAPQQIHQHVHAHVETLAELDARLVNETET